MKGIYWMCILGIVSCGARRVLEADFVHLVSQCTMTVVTVSIVSLLFVVPGPILLVSFYTHRATVGAVVLLHGFKVLAIDLSRSRWHISEPVFCIVQYDNAITQYGKSFWFRLGMMKWSKYVWKSFWDHIPNKFPRMFRSDVNFVEVLERGVRGPCKVV
jgi:hypothetical protein